jgi:hypothetical protein
MRTSCGDLLCAWTSRCSMLARTDGRRNLQSRTDICEVENDGLRGERQFVDEDEGGFHAIEMLNAFREVGKVVRLGIGSSLLQAPVECVDGATGQCPMGGFGDVPLHEWSKAGTFTATCCPACDRVAVGEIATALGFRSSSFGEVRCKEMVGSHSHAASCRVSSGHRAAKVSCRYH